MYPNPESSQLGRLAVSAVKWGLSVSVIGLATWVWKTQQQLTELRHLDNHITATDLAVRELYIRYRVAELKLSRPTKDNAKTPLTSDELTSRANSWADRKFDDFYKQAELANAKAQDTGG